MGGCVGGWVGGGGPEVVPVGSCQNEETRSRQQKCYLRTLSLLNLPYVQVQWFLFSQVEVV